MGSSNYDGGDCGGSHGVSDKWIKNRVTSGMKKASPQRAGKFLSKMSRKSERMEGHPNRHKAKVGAKATFAMHKGESGWDRWRAKKEGKTAHHLPGRFGHAFDEEGGDAPAHEFRGGEGGSY